MGLPKAYSGTFATTYRLKGASQDWAIRCFNRNVPDLRKRYDTLSSFYARHPLGFLVKAAYLDQGINVGNKWFPVIKMRWAEGQTLWNYIENNIADPSKLAKLAPAFRSIVGEMESLDIAHGDLQHGNILVRNDKLYLVDYDSFYLPELANLSATNAGHPHYQHPSRNSNQYDAKMDRFSALVIYLGLLAISNSNKLWNEKCNVGENILFTQDDFRNPNQSNLFTNLLTIPNILIKITWIVTHFRVTIL